MLRNAFMFCVVTVLSVQLLAAAAPPPSRMETVTDTVHGVSVADPYRWLEGDNSIPTQMGRMTAEVAEWTDAQNAYTREFLDQLPGRREIEDRLRPLMQVGMVGAPDIRANRYFFRKREGEQPQSILYVREGHDGADRVLIDPAEIDPSGLTTLSFTEPSHDGRLLAFGVYRSGDENTTLHVLNVGTGRWLADEIPGKVGGVSWLPDGSGFLYRRLADVADPYSAQIRLHTIGEHSRDDPVLLSQHDLSGFYPAGAIDASARSRLATTYGPFAYLSRDARWMIVGYYTGTRSNDLWVADFDGYRRTGELSLRPILSRTLESAASGWGPVIGETLYLRTTLDAPNGRVVAVDLNDPDPALWRTIVPEPEDAVIQSLDAARGILVVRSLTNASTRLDRYTLDGGSLGAVSLPGIGSASISTSEDRTEAFVSFESFNEPRSIYRVDLRTNERSLWARPDVPVDPSVAVVRQVWYTSKDGTRVSMFVVHRSGLRLDGQNPTILYGYGGFNISQTPRFSPTLFPWLEDGGVYAVPNIRGGGEYGQEWHRDGMLEKKQNVYDDFIAAAEYLFEQGYTSPSRLGIIGGSNGGLLTGAVAMQRPELFGAVVVSVPLLDMIRYQHFLMARFWIPEYGSSEDPEMFPVLLAYSPYHNIREGVEYPAMLITTGENDARVHPMHARKMAAALQNATASDRKERPVLLWVDRDSGHGAGKPLNIRLRDAVDVRMFFMSQLGMPVRAGSGATEGRPREIAPGKVW